ncbi:hypothetical protein [Rossellomorea sp. BNER]|uniref:hypothetical protein n=1 Tax=Rossellomorea sp. BNER TaxID=2962031 RepID=UPI003AF22067
MMMAAELNPKEWVITKNLQQQGEIHMIHIKDKKRITCLLNKEGIIVEIKSVS